MKRLIISLLLLFNAVYIYGQGNPSKVETEIRNLEERERNAMLHRDTVVLQEMWELILPLMLL